MHYNNQPSASPLNVYFMQVWVSNYSPEVHQTTPILLANEPLFYKALAVGIEKWTFKYVMSCSQTRVCYYYFYFVFLFWINRKNKKTYEHAHISYMFDKLLRGDYKCFIYIYLYYTYPWTKRSYTREAIVRPFLNYIDRCVCIYIYILPFPLFCFCSCFSNGIVFRRQYSAGILQTIGGA